MPLLFILSNCIGQNTSFNANLKNENNSDLSQYFDGTFDLLEVKDLNEFIQTKKEENYSFDFSFTINKKELHFSFFLSDIISDDTQVNLSNDETKSIKDFGVKAFRGYCNKSGRVNSWLVVNDEYFILNYKIDNKHYILSPTNVLSKKWDGKFNTYILYDQNNLIKEEKEHFCGLKDQIKSENLGVNKMVTNDCRQINLASASDFSMFNKYSNAAGVITHLTDIYLGTALLYDDEFSYELDLRIVEYYISNTSSEFWPSTNNGETILNNFATWSGFTSSYNFKQLFTDRDIFQIQSGVANTGVVGLASNPGIISLIEDFSSNIDAMIVVVTHELGHNLNCVHDASGSNTIMAEFINITTNWSTNSIHTVNTYVLNNLGLLPACPFTWVDYNAGSNGNGVFNSPYNNLGSAVNAVPNNGTIRIKSSSGDPNGILINVTKIFNIHSWNGSAIIGN